MRYRSANLWHIVCLLLCCWAGATKGNTRAYGEFPEACVILPDSDKILQLNHVEVVATREANHVTATAPVQSIGQERMLRLGIQSMTDALKTVAGVTMRDYGGAGGMKTVSVRGMGARHTAVAYDGIVLSDCQTGEIDLSRYSLLYADNITLTIGDGDDIFQPARNLAAAATLQIEYAPQAPCTQTSSLKSYISLASWGTVNPSLCLTHSFNNRFRLAAIGEYTYAENNYPFTLKNINITTRERRTNSRMSSGHAELNAQWSPNTHSLLSGKAYYYDNNRQLPGIVHYYTNENDETLHERNAFAQLSYRTQFSSQWKLLGNAKWNWAMSGYHNGTGSATASARYNQREGYGSIAVLYAPLPWFSADYSADYIFNDLNGTLTSLSSPIRHSLLQALSAKIALPRLTIIARTLSATYADHAEKSAASRHTHRWSPSISASLKFFSQEELYLRLMWKDIFRMPTFNELYYFHIGNQQLSPEDTRQWNFGITWKKQVTTTWWLTATIDGYTNTVSNKIVAIPFNMFVWRTMNLAKVRNNGIDITTDLRWQCRPKHEIELTGNYTFQKAENRSNKASEHYGKQIAYTPQQTWSATAGWLNPWLNLSVTLSGMSCRWATNEHADGTRISGFAETSLNAWRNLHFGHLKATVRGSILNLFDKQYAIVAHYPMPGRSWRLTIGVDF